MALSQVKTVQIWYSILAFFNLMQHDFKGNPGAYASGTKLLFDLI
jgi:hypothetical protein